MFLADIDRAEQQLLQLQLQDNQTEECVCWHLFCTQLRIKPCLSHDRQRAPRHPGTLALALALALSLAL